jgi:hypothetical protein
MPGSDMAIFLNKLFTLCPAFADVSMNKMLRAWAFAVASSSVTCLRHVSIHAPSWGRHALEAYEPLVRKVRLVPDKYNHDIASSLRPHVIYPFRCGEKRLTV